MDDKLIKMADDLEAKVDEYVNNILTGKINSCKKHKWACERYLKDRRNEEYIFDNIELLKVYIWAKQFKHYKGELAGQYIDLTPFQLFIVANIFCFKLKENGLRRFRKVYIQLARKNAIDLAC